MTEASKYTPVIGLEIHTELKTKTKMFCRCVNDPEEKTPNRNICPICIAHPGALPMMNKEAVDAVLKLGIAIGGKIASYAHFDRKSYFYPDLPKGYQISQYEHPFVERGLLTGIRITRVHLEEDTARLLHELPGGRKPDTPTSFVDFNRAGVPLMELVTEPDIQTGEEAVKFARELQQIMRYIGISDANMERGQMRVEVNISLKKKDSDKLGVKVEIKNLNSFKSVGDSISYEIERQARLLDEGKEVIQETRGWSDTEKKTISQRSKESAHDYRYFPEPDLPPLNFSDDRITEIARSIPELPEAKRARFKKEFGITEDLIQVLTDDIFFANYFEEAVSELQKISSEKADTTLLANYLTSDMKGLLKEEKKLVEDIRITPEHIARLVSLITEKKISSRIAKDLLREMYASGEGPETIMKTKGTRIVSDESELVPIVKKIIEKNEKAVSEFKKGKTNALQFLIGQGMRETRGQASPEKLKEVFEKELG